MLATRDLTIRICAVALLVLQATGCAHDPRNLDRGLAKGLLETFWTGRTVHAMVNLPDRMPDTVAAIPDGAHVEDYFARGNPWIAAFLKAGYAERRYENASPSGSDWNAEYGISEKGLEQKWRRDSTNTAYVPIATMDVSDVEDLQINANSATAKYICTANPNELGKVLLADGLSTFTASPVLSDAAVLPLGKSGNCTATFTLHDDGWKLVVNPDA